MGDVRDWAGTTEIVVVEDDPTVAEIVTRYLEREGYQVAVIANGLEALATLTAREPDLVVLDLMLPGLDGLALCRRLRATSAVPVIMLTARGEAADRIAGLELGADDYLAKPFSPRELTARVRAVLTRSRRSDGPAPQRLPLVAGPVALDERARTVTVRGEPVSLTIREFDLLAFLLHNPGQAFRREELLRHVWGYTFGDTSTVTVHVRRLREKIEADPSDPQLVQTVWGVGYRLDA